MNTNITEKQRIAQMFGSKPRAPLAPIKLVNRKTNLTNEDLLAKINNSREISEAMGFFKPEAMDFWTMRTSYNSVIPNLMFPGRFIDNKLVKNFVWTTDKDIVNDNDDKEVLNLFLEGTADDKMDVFLNTIRSAYYRDRLPLSSMKTGLFLRSDFMRFIPDSFEGIYLETLLFQPVRVIFNKYYELVQNLTLLKNTLQKSGLIELKENPLQIEYPKDRAVKTANGIAILKSTPTVKVLGQTAQTNSASVQSNVLQASGISKDLRTDFTGAFCFVATPNEKIKVVKDHPQVKTIMDKIEDYSWIVIPNFVRRIQVITEEDEENMDLLRKTIREAQYIFAGVKSAEGFLNGKTAKAVMERVLLNVNIIMDILRGEDFYIKQDLEVMTKEAKASDKFETLIDQEESIDLDIIPTNLNYLTGEQYLIEKLGYADKTINVTSVEFQKYNLGNLPRTPNDLTKKFLHWIVRSTHKNFKSKEEFMNFLSELAGAAQYTKNNPVFNYSKEAISLEHFMPSGQNNTNFSVTRNEKACIFTGTFPFAYSLVKETTK